MAHLIQVRMRVPITDSRRLQVPAGGIAHLHKGAAQAAIRRGDATEHNEAVPPGPVLEQSYVQPPTGETRPDPVKLRARRQSTVAGGGRETTDAGKLEDRLPPAPVDLSKLSRNEALKTIRECENPTLLAKWHADLGEDRPAGYTVMQKAIEDRHAELKGAPAEE